jgi:hypothetical protein
MTSLAKVTPIEWHSGSEVEHGANNPTLCDGRH